MKLKSETRAWDLHPSNTDPFYLDSGKRVLKNDHGVKSWGKKTIRTKNQVKETSKCGD